MFEEKVLVLCWALSNTALRLTQDVLFGVDRILMELTDEQNVRETLAFPKNGSGVDVMMNSPSVVDPAQLREWVYRIFAILIYHWLC